MKPIAGASPRLIARIAGLLYLIIFIAAPSSATTATPAKMITTLVCDTGVALMLYELLKPVSGGLCLLAALFRLIFVAVMAVNSLSYFSAVVLLGRAHSAAAFDAGYGIAMVPFGVHCLLLGYLISVSTFLPRTLGILVALARKPSILSLSSDPRHPRRRIADAVAPRYGSECSTMEGGG